MRDIRAHEGIKNSLFREAPRRAHRIPAESLRARIEQRTYVRSLHTYTVERPASRGICEYEKETEAVKEKEREKETTRA